jgi:hypothetical protein
MNLQPETPRDDSASEALITADDPHSSGGRRVAVVGLASLAAGVLMAQLPHPFGFPSALIGPRLTALGTHPAVAAAAFALTVGGALALGALVRSSLPIPSFTDRPPAVTLKARPIGIVLLALAAVSLTMVCALARQAVATAWFMPLSAMVLGLAIAGLKVCGPPPPPAADTSATLRPADLLWGGAMAAVVGWSATRWIDHWYYSWIGDEVSFFEGARDLIGGPPANIFELAFVHSKHSVVDSLYQSLFLRIFGADVVGWRLAEVAVAVVAACLAYVVVIRLTPATDRGRFGLVRLPAVIAGLVVGCSAYTLAFCHIGYNNLHTLVPPLLIILCLISIASRPSAVRLFVLGCLLGLCLYTFLATIIFWLVLAVFFAPGLLSKGPRGRFTAAAVVIGGLVCTTLPILAANQTQLIENLRASHALGIGAERNWVLGWAGSAGAFWHNSRYFNHHLAASLIDPFAGALAAIGVGAAVVLFRRSPFDRLLLLWFVLGTLAVAVTHSFTWPSFTRLLFVLPAVAFLAGRGATVLVDVLVTRLGRSPTTARLVLLSVIVLLVIVNSHQLYAVVPLRLPPTPFTSTVRALQEHPASPVVEVAYQMDPNREVLLGPYPDLAPRFSWMTPARLASVLDRLDPASIFLVYQSRRLAGSVAEIVGPRWNGTCYLDSGGRCLVWIFEPAAVAGIAGPDPVSPQP